MIKPLYLVIGAVFLSACGGDEITQKIVKETLQSPQKSDEKVTATTEKNASANALNSSNNIFGDSSNNAQSSSSLADSFSYKNIRADTTRERVVTLDSSNFQSQNLNDSSAQYGVVRAENTQQSSSDLSYLPSSPNNVARSPAAVQSAIAQLKQSDILFVLHFSYDDSEINESAVKEILKHANFMHNNPNVKLRIEGHADERGTREYNLALGENRALNVKEVLALYDLSARVEVVSYGEEKPLSRLHNAKGWQQNRRVEFIYE